MNKIERLQREVGYIAGLVRQALIEKEAARNAVIEECAREALRYPYSSVERIAAAIRALKNKQP